MEQLHEHNQRTYENICRMYGEGIQRVAVVQPTGSGKSLLMAKLIEDNPDSRFFVLSTSHKINNQFKEKLDENALKRVDFNIYCNMPNMSDETMKTLQADYILLDEMHRALAKEWSKGINVLLEMYPNAKVLGLSATPIRYLDRCRNVVEELFNSNLACDMSLSQAILDGILPMARYVCGVYSYEKDTESLNKKIAKSCNSDEEKKELLEQVKVLKQNLDKANGVSEIFRKYVVSGNEKFVVFLKDTTHLRDMKPVIEKWFTDAGFAVRMYEVHCKNVDKDKEFQAFKEDTGEGVKLCLSINMVAEGIHGDIDGVIMLRETMSPNLYFQMIGRAFSCGKKTIPLIFDLVANSQFISDAVDNFPNELRREIEKRKEECEKEGRDYEVGFNVDEFIVMDEFMDVVSGFRAIEGKLIGDWDAMFREYCKFYQENGHGDVPKTEEYRELNLWCRVQRSSLISGNMNKEREKLLEVNDFILNLYKYRFEKNIKDVANYYEKYGIFPSGHSADFSIKRLGNFIRSEKIKMRKDNYPIWKKEIINKYLMDFSWKTNLDQAFERFIYFAKLYKENYATMNIKNSDVIDGYHIGTALNEIKKKNKNGKLSDVQKEELNSIGIYLGNKLQQQFNSKMKLAKLAVNDGIIINNNNQVYNKTNLYTWITTTVQSKYQNKELAKEDSDVIATLVNKPLYQYFNKGSFVKIVDVTENKEMIYKSYANAAKDIREKFGLNVCSTTICNCLNGKVFTPYKGRFMFYYATDEEVKKYLEEN